MIVEVIVDVSTSELDRVFDYEGDVPLGSRVSVPFGHRQIEGFVIGKKEKSDCSVVKPVTEVLTGGVLPELLSLMHYMTRKYNLRCVDVLRLFVPAELRGGRVREQRRSIIYINPDFDIATLDSVVRKNAVQQLALLDYYRDLPCGEGVSRADLVRCFGDSAVKGLLDKNVLVCHEEHFDRRPLPSEISEEKVMSPTPRQQSVIAEILKTIHPLREEGAVYSKGRFLLHGVTGSGKTLVYQTIIERVLSEGKSAVLLVPEISLTPQMLRLMRAKFGDKVAILHSGLSQGERYDEWMRLYRGEARLAVGARSALFAPLSNLGLIVVDEEHDGSYVSDSNPRYDAREVARFRAENKGACLVLGSATPDIETYYAAMNGEYTLLEMPERVSGAVLPPIELVNMADEFRLGNRDVFSASLKQALAETVQRGEQAMIFLNRRGYSSFLMCKSCGYIAKCDECDVSLTYHREDNRMKCHYCGKQWTALTVCPECGNTDLRLGRSGTEQIVEEVKKLLPDARVLRMDNDTTSTKDAHSRILTAFGRHEADVLVGTQMIAKGHDFANVTLVGILDADFSLYFSDYRSPEKVFQLVTQVAGRAGRAEKRGRVILQTFSPRHYVFRYAQTYDYRGFYKKECNAREVTKYPPFTKILRVLVSGDTDEETYAATRDIYRRFRELNTDNGDFVYLGAMKAPVKRVKNKYRYQVIMRLKPCAADDIIARAYTVINEYKTSKIMCFAEINPQNPM